MNPDETVMLARYVRALCPQQKFDEYTADAWHDVLGTHNLNDTREAATRIARRQPFIAPAEIIAEVRVIRDERLEGFVYEPATDDETPQQYLANLRAQREAVASGHRPANPTAAALTGGPHPTVLPALQSATRQVPDDQPAPTPGPLTTACPQCKAPIGKHCRWPNGVRRPTHGARRRAAAGQPTTDPGTAQAAAERRRAAAAALDRLTPQQRQQLDQFQQRLLADEGTS